MTDNRSKSYFLERVAKDMIRRFGEDFRDVAVVFNNKRPAQFLNKFLSQHIGEVFWSPRYYTVQEFIRAGHPLQEVNATTQAFILNQLHTELQTESYREYEESLAHFFPVAELILADFQQLDFEMVNADLLYADLQDVTVLANQFDVLTQDQQEFLKRFWSTFSNEKNTEMHHRFLALWQILPQLYERFKKSLTDQGMQTMAGMYRDVAENPAMMAPLMRPFKKVLFVGFNALNACEKTLFRRWQSEGKALFYFDLDAHYVEDVLQEAGLFVRRNLRDIGLINALQGIPCRIKRPRAGEKSVEVISAPGHMAQAKALALLLESQNPGQNTAIILADEDLLVPVLQSIPPHINPNITMGYPFEESLTSAFLHIYVQGQLYYDQHLDTNAAVMDHGVVMDFLSHPYNGFSDMLQIELRNLANELDATEIPLARLNLKEHPFSHFFARQTDGKSFVQGLLQVLEEMSDRMQDLEGRGALERTLIDQAIDDIQQLRQALDTYPDLGVSLTSKLVTRILRQITATLPGDALSGVQIMGLLESRNLHFDRIFLLGANEGNLPAGKSSSSLIPYHLRKAHGLPVLDDQNGLSAYLFYRLFHVPVEMTVIHNSLVDPLNSGELSRFVKQLAYETCIPFEFRNVQFGRATETPAIHHQYGASGSIAKDGIVWDRLSEYFTSASSDGIGTKSRTLSASAFCLYLNSPMEFFLKYIAGIKEPPTLHEDIQSNRLGNVIHRVMELCYLPFKDAGKTIQAIDIKAIRKELPLLCRQAIVEEFGRAQFSSQENIILKLSEAYCTMFLEHDEKSVAPFAFLELENTSDYVIDFGIQVQGEIKNIKLKGIIDRVDIGRDGIRIVDYKTGKDSLDVPCSSPEDLEEPSEHIFFNGNWDKSNKAFLQTLYYTYIYEQISGKIDVQPQLYSVKNMAQGTHFVLKHKRHKVPVNAVLWPVVKVNFEAFLRAKLEELFDPDIPFMHPVDATVYEQSALAPFLASES